MVKDIISFYRNPYYYFNTGKNEIMRERFVILKSTYILCLSSAIIIILIVLLIDTILKSKFDFSIYENLSNNRKELRSVNSRWNTLLDTCLIGPFEEEVAFRLVLIASSYFFRITIFLVFLKFIIPWNLLNISPFMWNMLLLFILVNTLIFNKVSEQDHPVFRREIYNYLCWFLTISFALVHINNFAPLNWSIIYLYPFYVLPQFVYGVVFSYVAIRYNSIVWPFLLHVAINSTAEITKLLTEVF